MVSTPKVLRLGPGLDLPLNFATEGVLATGMRGSGKSNSLTRWAEVLYGARIPFVVIDPKGDWAGIRSSADGKQPGLSVPVFGGMTGNFPLDEHHGQRIADLLVDTGLSAILDVSRLSIGARVRFLTDWCERLMDRHQREPHVRNVIFEEAHRYIPQVVPGPVAKLKEAAASILLEGRAFGLGCWAATQRVARLNKDVSEEVGTAIIHRIGVAATNDLKTIAGWVKHEELSPEIIPTLTKLADGEAWILAPETLGFVKRVQIDRRQTYDSAATPLVGASFRPVVTMADIDADAINKALADAIEKAKETDPKEQRRLLAERDRRITELERQLAAAPTEVAKVEVEVEVEVRVPYAFATEAALEAWLDGGTRLGAAVRDIQEGLAAIGVAQRAIDERFVGIGATPPPSTERTAPRTIDALKPSKPQVSVPASRDIPRDNHGRLGKAERAILTVLAQHPDGRSASQLCMQTGYTWSGGFRNSLAALRTAGHVAGANSETMRATADGLEALGGWEPLPAGRALLDWWLDPDRANHLGKAERQVLAYLVKVHPEPWTGESLAHACGYEWSGGFRNALSSLRTLHLIAGSNSGGMTAADDLMAAIA